MNKLMPAFFLLALLIGCSSDDDNSVLISDPMDIDTARTAIVGDWSIEVDVATQCTEILTFREDNTFASSELDERVDGRYVIAPNPENKPLLVVQAESTNALPNCAGENIAEPQSFQALVTFPGADILRLTNVATEGFLDYTKVTATSP